jgi:hypothetical protein
MKQQRFNFAYGRNGKAAAEWPAIVAADPAKYPGLLQELAALELHRSGKVHASDRCPLCEPRNA